MDEIKNKVDVSRQEAIKEAFEQKERADIAEKNAEDWKRKYEECMESK